MSQELDLSNAIVQAKQQAACDIANAVLVECISKCVPGADIATICEFGDEELEKRCQTVYTKKVNGESVRRGAATPTCISVNDICAHFSPLEKGHKLEEGDIVKIDLGAHIDGFCGIAGHTMVCGNVPVEGAKANVLRAVWTAAEATIRTIKIGNTNKQVTDVIRRVANIYHVEPVQGVLSHQMKQFVLDSNNCIINREMPEEKVPEMEFEANQVYGVDIVYSTGDGKVKETDFKTTVYKRDVSVTTMLKSPKARAFIAEVSKKYPTMPFNIRGVSEDCRRLGLNEALRNGLLHNYPVLREGKGETVASIKFTVWLLPSGTKKVSGLWEFPQEDLCKCDIQVEDEDLKVLLQEPIRTAQPKSK